MAEKEYIEREAALNAIKDEIENYQPNPDRYSITPYEFVRRGLNIAYSIIKNQSTAYVQEVRHGEWVKSKHSKFGNEFKCPFCDYFYFTDNMGYKFCPNCGAKMDKE